MKKLKFSIVIAVAPERNAEVLKSLELADYPKSKYETIIKVGKNPSNNRNSGAGESKGEIIAFIDDDAVVKEDILKEAEKFFNQHQDISIVGGPQLTPLDEKGFAKISGYALCSVFGAWKMANRYFGKRVILDADETMLTSANLFCRRKVLERIKFDQSLFPGEDPAFISDAKKEGFKVAYSPDLVVYHRRRKSPLAFAKQIYSYGKTRPKKESIRETIKMPFFLLPSLFLIYIGLLVITLIGGALQICPGILKSNNLSFILFLPIAIYLVLDICFSIANATSKKDIAALFFLPWIYPMIHLSYGAGFLRGCLKK
jgi:GT2 family glycosyltransferase